ncbi:WXG100 family type VII secretion target [Streptomyces millisiae]|uniref:WXG100 family type VII secretion target n=1 Tax=Streptomyces millisiae TaxID=3075542 RepID=A0ABU2LMF1_9ACTN|nr:WXG100 family type VII secretion target [Streptomyces sp. DSM 44918]MDT0318743.1 WXG100 family type VII secretion target [Streptomyces sp. DSM 44918]
MYEQVKLSPEEVDRVMAIVAGAYGDMETVSARIGAHAGTVGTAYNGMGTATAVETYENLQRAGQALANALDGLSQDLGVTSATGRETDDAAHGTLGRVLPVNVSADTSIAAQF